MPPGVKKPADPRFVRKGEELSSSEATDSRNNISVGGVRPTRGERSGPFTCRTGLRDGEAFGRPPDYVVAGEYLVAWTDFA